MSRFFCILALLLFSTEFGVFASDALESLFEDILIERLGLPSNAIVDITLKYDNVKSKASAVSFEDVRNTEISSIDREKKTFSGYVFDNSGKKTKVDGLYSTYVKVLSATCIIKKGDVITKDNVALVNGDYAVFSNYVPDEIYGMQSRRTITSGSIVKPSDLFFPISIKEKDVVDIVYTSKNVYLKTKGIALQRGAVGDYIKIKNEKSGALLVGKVIHGKTVEVKSNDEK